MVTFRKLLLAFAFVCPTLQAETPKEIKIDFASGWRRQIVSESVGAGHTLVLAIDIPAVKSLRARLVARKIFKSPDLDQINAFIDTLRKPSSFTPDVTGEMKISPNAVWPIDHNWTLKDEDNYAQWLNQNAGEGMLQGGGVDVDCADFAITLRWIYAHDHHLPAGDQQAASGDLVGSWSSSPAWDQLPTNSDWKKDERFKAALRYVLATTFTHSLLTDLYPVEIKTDLVKPGAIYLTLFEDSGHTRTIYNIGKGENCDPGGTDCISIVWGNEPSSEMGFISTLVPWRLNEGEGGFLRFRWPQQMSGIWQLTPPEQMPGFSKEQFAWTDADYINNVASRLGIWTTPEALYVNQGSIAVRGVMDRLTITSVGYFMCSLLPCQNDDSLYNTWSTPQRDHSLQMEIGSFQQMSKRVDPNNEAVLTFAMKHKGPVFSGSPYTVLDYLNGPYVNSTNGDPTVDFFTRWGSPNMSSDMQLYALGEVVWINWLYREGLVGRAQDLCYPKGSTTKKCDPSSPNVQNLSTSRLDQAFRIFEATYLKSFANLSDQTKRDMLDWLTKEKTNEKLCGGSGKDQCTMLDFLITNPAHIQNMSSAPDAPASARFGF